MQTRLHVCRCFSWLDSFFPSSYCVYTCMFVLWLGLLFKYLVFTISVSLESFPFHRDHHQDDHPFTKTEKLQASLKRKHNKLLTNTKQNKQTLCIFPPSVLKVYNSLFETGREITFTQVFFFLFFFLFCLSLGDMAYTYEPFMYCHYGCCVCPCIIIVMCGAHADFLLSLTYENTSLSGCCVILGCWQHCG